MRGIVYKQAYNYHIRGIPINEIRSIKVSKKELMKEFIRIKCEECGGTGKFGMPDGVEEECVCCKGSGFNLANLV